MDVKLGQMPTWLAARDYSPTGIAGGFRRGECLDNVGCGRFIPLGAWCVSCIVVPSVESFPLAFPGLHAVSQI